MKFARESGVAVLFVMAGLISICLAIPFAVPVDYAQETLTVLKPDQLVTFSLAPEQERLFVLRMKKGDFADIQSLAREGLNLSLEICDSTRKDLLEKSDEGEDFIWFVAPRDGDFILVSKPGESADISGSEKISIQYNNRFKLPPGTKLKGIRKVNGFDVKIMATPESSEVGGSILLIEKNGQLQKAMKRSGGFSFDRTSAEVTRELRTTRDTGARIYLTDELKNSQLIETAPDKTGDGLPDIMVHYFSGGAHCCFETYFINLGETVKTVESIVTGDAELGVVGKNPKGGLLFRTYDYVYAYWLTSFATSPAVEVVMEFRNGKLRPNFDLMKKPVPSLAVLRKKAEFYGQKLSLESYKGDENNASPLDFKDPFYKENAYPNNANETYRGAVYRNVVFWGPMLDLIYTGNEELAWQFLDLVWPPQKQGKALFIRDFKKKLLESEYWKMILEDKKK